MYGSVNMNTVKTNKTKFREGAARDDKKRDKTRFKKHRKNARDKRKYDE